MYRNVEIEWEGPSQWCVYPIYLCIPPCYLAGSSAIFSLVTLEAFFSLGHSLKRLGACNYFLKLVDGHKRSQRRNNPKGTLHKQNAENWKFETANLKQIFPEKEYWRISPNFHIHVSVSELYIPTMGLPFLLEEMCGPILGIYKSITDTWMWNLGLRPRNSQKRNI